MKIEDSTIAMVVTQAPYMGVLGAFMGRLAYEAMQHPELSAEYEAAQTALAKLVEAVVAIESARNATQEPQEAP